MPGLMEIFKACPPETPTEVALPSNSSALLILSASELSVSSFSMVILAVRLPVLPSI